MATRRSQEAASAAQSRLPEVALPEAAAARVRGATLDAMGEDELTLTAIERAVGQLLAPSPPSNIVEHVVNELETVGLVEQTSDRKRFRLTDAGRLRYRGLRALSNG